MPTLRYFNGCLGGQGPPQSEVSKRGLMNMGAYEKVAKKQSKNPFFSPQIEVLRQITIKISLFDVFPS